MEFRCPFCNDALDHLHELRWVTAEVFALRQAVAELRCDSRRVWLNRWLFGLLPADPAMVKEHVDFARHLLLRDMDCMPDSNDARRDAMMVRPQLRVVAAVRRRMQREILRTKVRSLLQEIGGNPWPLQDAVGA